MPNHKLKAIAVVDPGFPRGGGWMKLKEFGPVGGGVTHPSHPPERSANE